MRVLPRFVFRRFKPFVRRLRRLWRRVTVARAAFALECLAFGAATLFLLTGSRLSLLDRWGRRADAAALAAASILFGVVHTLARRRIVPRLERYFSPAAYDEHRILFDLGQEAHAASSVEQLYRFVVARIGEAVETESVAIFVREAQTGDFVCRVAAQRPARLAAHQTVSATGGTAVADTAQLRLARDAFVVRRLQHLSLPLSVTADDFEAWSRAFANEPDEEREARERESRTLRQIGSHLLVQIRVRNRIAGILSLGARRARHEYTQGDAEMLMSVASQLALIIENARLAERMVAEERLRRELVLAAEVQQRLFPARPPSSSAAELAGFCQPARGVGGDYYDFLTFGNNQIGIAVADVSGKGISAALLMSNVQASLRSQALAHNSPGPHGTLADLVSAMNRLLYASTGTASYVTFFYGQFDERTQQLTYVNAGHNPPLLVRDGGTWAESVGQRASGFDHGGRRNLRLDKGGMVVGMFEDVGYEEETIQLRTGDLLCAYTDGVTEATNAAGEEFGESRLLEVLAKSADFPAAKIRDEIVRYVQAWCVGVPQHDDLTFVILKVK
ncbi:MAG TPA: GAF domain-containing SpoIIE family protein phosphatase [Pyrinomonadaceae bacterium]|jgi:sigma-B regulation protein RsbU (phosphoserine phosphatase)|nr:GAF domain-containing SpoIIE family protein phosphatase [Pyrinomonadaceae bacterium]